jgi:hypothetical protein
LFSNYVISPKLYDEDVDADDWSIVKKSCGVGQVEEGVCWIRNFVEVF